MTHEDYKALLAARALTALDAEDTRALDAHLEGCADCRSEVNEWEGTAALLALDAKPLEPSPQLRERILAGVHAEGAAETSARDRVATSRESNVLAFERPRNVWASLGSFGAIAATFIFAALIISLVVLWQQNRAAQEKLARLSLEAEQARTQLDHEHAALEFFARPGMRMVELKGTKDAPAAHAMLAVDSKSGHAMLMARSLPAPPNGMAYQLWFIAGTQPMPGKVFKPDAAGNVMLDDQLPADALNAANFAVTLEPQAGVAAPTGPMYLLTRAAS
jgi:anti-sigma-K factor RskA